MIINNDWAIVKNKYRYYLRVSRLCYQNKLLWNAMSLLGKYICISWVLMVMGIIWVN